MKYARERLVPFLGICLGMQCAVVEYSRNICGLEAANSSEFSGDTPHPVVALMPDQEGVDHGGHDAAGRLPGILRANSLASEIYGGRQKSRSATGIDMR